MLLCILKKLQKKQYWQIENIKVVNRNVSHDEGEIKGTCKKNIFFVVAATDDTEFK